MQAYRITTDGACVTVQDMFRTTREHARMAALSQIPKLYHEQVRIELVEFQTDQQTLCELLEGERPELQVKRTWYLTPRGGLKEIANGE